MKKNEITTREITMTNINEFDNTKHYIVVADYEIYGKTKTCLVFATGTVENYTRLMTNPNKNDMYCLGNGVNPRLQEEEPEDCWWNVFGTN